MVIVETSLGGVPISILSVKLVDALPQMPLIPQIIRSFAGSEDQFDLIGFVDAVEKEPSVTARLVGHANSAFYHTGREVRSVKEAAIRLGLVQTKRVVLTLLLAEQFDGRRCAPFCPAVFWMNTMLRAQFTKHLLDYSPARERLSEEYMYCLSLVSDLGLLLVVSQHPEQLAPAFDRDADGIGSLNQGIRALFGGRGIHYFSAQLCEFWGLPDCYIDSYMGLEDEERSGYCADQVSLLKLADYMRKREPSGDDESTDIVGYGFALSKKDVEQVYRSVDKQRRMIKSLAEYMC